MMFPKFSPTDPTKLQIILDKQALVYKEGEYALKMAIGEQIKAFVEGIIASYRQNNIKQHLFEAQSINLEILKPAEEAKQGDWKFSDIKNIKIKKLSTNINQVTL